MAEFFFFPVDQSDPFAPPAFALDGVSSEEISTKAEATKVPIEAGERIADFSYTSPETYKVTGRISALMPLNAPRGDAGLTDLIKRARNAILDGLTLQCVFGYETAQVTLLELTRTRNHGIGQALEVSLVFQEIVEITVESTTIPASRFRRKVRRQAAPKVGEPEIPSGQIIQEDPIGRVKVRPDGIEIKGGGVGSLPTVSYLTEAQPFSP